MWRCVLRTSGYGIASWILFLLLGEVPGLTAAPPTLHISLGSLEYLGAVEIPTSPPVGSRAPVGGLSDLTWDPKTQSFFAISDDRAERGPARVYRFEVRLEGPKPKLQAVHLLEMIELTLPGRKPFPQQSIDLEGIDIFGDRLYVSSEGVPSSGAPPWIAVFSRDGEQLERLPLPDWYLPDGDLKGVRSNLGFEALGISPDGRYLFAGLENALVQDGPEAGFGIRSPVRILRWSLGSLGLPQEFLLEVEGVDQPFSRREGFRTNGLVALLPLGERELLTLERQFIDSQGYRLRLFRVRLEAASEITGQKKLNRREVTPASKELLLELGQNGMPRDNFEGLSWGPMLPDGRRTLWLIADDNFSFPNQRSWLIGFAWDEEPVRISRIQGAAHRSPLEGRWVFDLPGVVTAKLEDEKRSGFFMESPDPDADPSTSEGLWLTGAARLPAVGESVRVHGRVEERSANERELPLTTVLVSSWFPAAPASLPPPVEVAKLSQPAVMEDDALGRFEPTTDFLDLLESLEGMRVTLSGGIVTGPTTWFQELVVWPDGWRLPAGRTHRGGLLRTPEGAPPGRWLLSGRLVGELPQLLVGSRVRGPITGIVDYEFSTFRLLLTSNLQVDSVSQWLRCQDPTRLRRDRSSWTLGTLNVENLSARSSQVRFRRLAEVVVRQMHSPSVLALQEIQDDSGPEDDEVVTSEQTLDRFRRAILEAGGPRYRAIWIDPERNREGGQPGGNIRVAVLVDPADLKPVLRGKPGPLSQVEAVLLNGNLALSPSPGRVAPEAPAFSLPQGEGVRRSLALELERHGEPVFLVVNHWSSKRGDDREQGAHQPPQARTEPLRLAQAREIRLFAEQLLAMNPQAAVAMVGDLNDFETSAAVKTLAAAPFENLILRLPPGERYSFNFEGTSQVLDHVIVSPRLAAAAEVDVVHVHSDCPEEERGSDHDPIVVRFLDSAAHRGMGVSP